VSREGINFNLVMRDRDGVIVPGSHRFGHNIFTSAGRDLLAQLVAWSAFSDPDVAYTNRRARYVGLGDGIQIEDAAVVRLVSPLQVSYGVFLKQLDPTLTVFVADTIVSVKVVFGTAEITYASSSVVVSEAGLYFDVSPGGVLQVTSSTNVPAFYKSFSPVVKLNSFTMEITWELKF